MIPIQVTIGPSVAAGVSTGIALAQTLGAAGNLTLNGSLVTAGVATMDVARQVIIASVGNDSGITFTITGTNSDNNPIRETLNGTNAGTAASTQAYKTVTRIAASAATAANVTAGTNGVVISAWKYIDWFADPSNISFAGIVSGTVNWSVELAYQDPSLPAANVIGSQALGNFSTAPVPFPHPVLTGLVANQDSSTNAPIICWRVKLNSGSGSITVVSIQSGLPGNNWS